MNYCITCGTETKNPKFCTRSCSAKYTNKHYPKRKPEGLCFLCNDPINTSHKYCIKCRPTTRIDWERTSIEDVVKSHGISRHSKIREHSRRVYLSLGKPYECEKCGYDKHVEVCHIKAIKDFTMDTSIAEVNSADNLIGLCPNCHWEHDNL